MAKPVRKRSRTQVGDGAQSSGAAKTGAAKTGTANPGVGKTGAGKNGFGKTGPGNPPVATRFQPGQSGNPAGRPPKERNFIRIVNAELDTEMQITENAIAQRLTKREILAKRMVNAALQGDGKAMAALMRLIAAGSDEQEHAAAAVSLEAVLAYLGRNAKAEEPAP